MLSDNGWTCLSTASRSLRRWNVGPVQLWLRTGPAGFLLAHWATWWHLYVEPLQLRDMPLDHDDHGHGTRFIGGGTSGVPSNHWSATAVDLNARRHPQGVPTLETFTSAQARKIRNVLATKYPGLIWGGDWNAVDSMHTEFDDISRFTKSDVTALALRLVDTPTGRKVIAAQPQPVTWQNW